MFYFINIIHEADSTLLLWAHPPFG